LENQPIVIDNRIIARIVAAVVVVVVIIWLLSQGFKTVPAGHVGVATLFGNVRDKPFNEGLHFPVNPLYGWLDFDCRQKTHQEKVGVPSQDQLTTAVDISVQYRIIGEMTPQILRDTGSLEQTLAVHLVPKVRSVLREQGKTIERAEDFFLEETQQRLQISLLDNLQATLRTKGIEVSDVLIRDIRLPARLIAQIEQKKETEQLAERQKAELGRFKTEQQQLIASAEAKRRAAEEEAIQRRLLADAQAYEIEKINEAVANKPAYIQLQALDALRSISKDPAAKIYFLNADSPMPLPLMHMGSPGE